MDSTSSGSSKRTRMVTHGSSPVPSCLVDGCTSDLSKCRDYHRRHKVCEIHSKTPKVFIKGLEQRFCQQCSRFHSLLEFDERKRSCRKRLEGHNRRRRKPQPDPLSLNSTSLFSNFQGTRYLQFGGSQMFSSSAMSSNWATAVKQETDPMLCDNHTMLDFGSRKGVFTSSMSHEYKEGKQLSFLQGTTGSFPPRDPVVGQPGGLSRVIDSNRALSLLSSPLNETHQGIGVGHHLMQNSSSSQSLIPSLTNYENPRNVTEPVGPNYMVCDDGSSVTVHDVHGQAMFHQIGHDMSSTSGSHQTLSFSWEEE